MNIGFNGGGHHRNLETVVREARCAANAGLKSYWLSQILGLDSLTALAVIGREVSGIELGASIVPVYGRHPVALAAQALTVQAACAGRLTLGIGSSHRQFVEGVLGEDYAHPFQRTEEVLECLCVLLRGDAVRFVGKSVAARGQLTIDAPMPPVLIAALGRKMLGLAGRRAAGTTLWMVGPKTIREHIAPTIDSAAQESGRPRPRILAGVTVSVTDDPNDARTRAATKLAMYRQLPAYRAALDREGVAGPEDLLIAGDEDAIEAGLRTYFDAGATELRVGVLDDDAGSRDRTLEVLGRLSDRCPNRVQIVPGSAQEAATP